MSSSTKTNSDVSLKQSCTKRNGSCIRAHFIKTQVEKIIVINRGPVWTSVYHNKCRQQQFSLWRVHLLIPFNKFPASSNFLSVSVVEFYFLNGRQNPVNGKLMNSNAVRKREKKAKFVRLLSSFTIFISTQITFFSFFFEIIIGSFVERYTFLSLRYYAI